MGPAYYVIAILGCADGGAQCAPVATVPTQYRTEAACAAGTSEALLANSDFDFPTIVAECRSVSAPEAAAREKPRPIPAGARQG